MNILLIGAGGFIGGRLVRRFLVAGDRVKACGRNLEKLRRSLPGAEVVAADYNQDGVEAWLPRLQGVEVVINAAGVIGDCSGNRMSVVHAAGPRALFQACFQAGVGRVNQISALGADPTGATHYYRSKGEADAFLASLDPLSTANQPQLKRGRMMRVGGCDWNYSVLFAIKTLSMFSHGRGHRFKPCAAHHFFEQRFQKKRPKRYLGSRFFFVRCQ